MLVDLLGTSVKSSCVGARLVSNVIGLSSLFFPFATAPTIIAAHMHTGCQDLSPITGSAQEPLPAPGLPLI
jgi:hypothetical protein